MTTLLDFSLGPSAVQPLVAAAIARASVRLSSLTSQPCTFTNTIAQLDLILGNLEAECCAAIFLKYCSPDSAVRDAAHAAESELGRFLIEVSAREDLFNAARSVSPDGLDTVDARLLNKTLNDFRRAGLELAPADREIFSKTRRELLDLELQFGKNLNEVRDFLSVTRDELEGLPEDYIARLARLPDGGYKVTLDYPDSLPFMSKARSGAARRKLHELTNRRAVPANVLLLDDILAKRRQLATLLGLPSYAHFVLEERMARSPDAVKDFLGRLRTKLEIKAADERQKLLALKNEGEPGPLAPWDVAYCHQRLLQRDFAVDDFAVAQYLPLEKVAAGMFAVYAQIFGVKFERRNDTTAWHQDVRVYTVSDGGGELGLFYLDLFPRDGKFKHAAVFPLVRGRRLQDGSRSLPSAAMLTNFSPPTAGKPALLRHSELETFFHEFGHVLHNMLTESTYHRFSGTKVARDFVEAPSQIMENWAWEKTVLRSISGHWKTGEPLPDALIEHMLAAKQLDGAIFALRQLAFACIDQALHGAESGDTAETYRKLYQEITTFPVGADTRPEASFGHLMSYAASYYGYLWSDVYSADMYSVFAAADDAGRIGARYRKTVLAPGGSQEEADLVRRFLGREPSEDAFLESLGLKPVTTT